VKGRNDLCFCGSGKKYKKCHIPMSKKAWEIITLKTRQAEAAHEMVIPGRLMRVAKK